MRENLNQFSKSFEEKRKFEIIEGTSDMLDGWREVDKFYADNLSANLFMSVKQSREWQIFQWYDGITLNIIGVLRLSLTNIFPLIIFPLEKHTMDVTG